MDKKLTTRKKALMIAAFVGLAVIVTSGISAVVRGKENQMETPSNAVSVKVQLVKQTEAVNDRVYKANLEPYNEAEVSSNTAGRVVGVYFENGEQVKKGQTLVTLDDVSLQNKLKTARLELQKLQIESAIKEKRFGNAQTLFENGANAKSELEDAELAYKTATLECDLKKVEIENLVHSIGECVIRADLSGGIVEKNIAIGQYISPGGALAKIKNNQVIKAKTQLLIDDLESLSAGQTVSVGLSEEGEKPYTGVVETISESASSQTRTFDCVIVIQNPEGKLNSGISGYVEFPLKDNKMIRTVPASAVVGNQGAYSVFTEKDGKALQVPVTLGKISNERIEVTSGLKDGDRIIVTNSNSLQSGDRVEVSGGI